MSLPTQDEYIRELKFITHDLCAAVFTLQCLYLYGSGQIPALEDCPKALVESCWQNTQDSLRENLQNLAQTVRFLEASMEQPTVTPA